MATNQSFNDDQRHKILTGGLDHMSGGGYLEDYLAGLGEGRISSMTFWRWIYRFNMQSRMLAVHGTRLLAGLEKLRELERRGTAKDINKICLDTEKALYRMSHWQKQVGQ